MWRVVPIAILALLSWWILPLTGVARAGAALACGAAAYLALGWVLRRAFDAALRAPFAAKGAVLRGARVQVHRVEPVDVAALDAPGDDGAAPPPQAWRIEVTVTPTGAVGGPFRLWEPGELQLVPADEPMGKDGPPASDVEIRRIDIDDDGRWIADEGMKYVGPQRLRVTAACAGPPAGALAFGYYLERFGRLTLAPRE